MMTTLHRCSATTLALLAITSPLLAYDPLEKATGKIEQLELKFKDEKRSRELPVRVYLPTSNSAMPVILFSHGLGGSRAGGEYLGNHWAARGYVGVFLQHPGSDDSVWKDAPLTQKAAVLKNAANAEQFLLRVKDVPAVIDQLEKWNADPKHPLHKRMDLKHIGMSGHSFGAVTTQAVSGQTFLRGEALTDPRIKAALMMSPSVPKVGDPKKSFGEVKIPWLLMTGTKDDSPIGDADAKTRLNVFPALPDGDKFELVLNNAEHSAFSDRASPTAKEKRNPNHHKSILALSTAFWDAYLRNDPQAKKWLTSDGPKGILEKEDRWQKK